MIEILTGPAPAIHSGILQPTISQEGTLAVAPGVVIETSEGPTLAIPGAPHPGRSWNGLRGLLSGVADRLGEHRLRSLLASDPEAAGLMLDALPWDGVDPARRAELCAHPDSHLSHNWAVQRDFFQAWAELLKRIFAELPCRLLVADVARLDWETTALLKFLCRDGNGPDLRLGYDPDPAPVELDERGLAWGMAPEYVLEAVLSLRSVAGALHRDVEPERETAAEVPARVTASYVETPDGDLESRAWRLLATPERTWSEDEVETVVEAQRRAFRRFGFTSTLRLGLELVDRGIALQPEQTASVHGLLALAAHNRQFHAAGNVRLGELLDHHLRIALEAETRPARRSALLYRLAVTAGRRLGRPTDALAWADRAVEEARTVAEPWKAAYLEAWGRNIRAFAHMRAGSQEESKDDCERAWEILSAAHERGPGDLSPGEGPTRRDLGSSLALLATNRSVLSWVERDSEDFQRWRGAARELEWTQPGAARYEAGGWVEFYRHELRLDRALEAALAGLESARGERDVLRERRYLLEAADLSYRLGRAEQARSFYREERDLRQRLGNPSYLGDPAVASAGASARAGHPEEARRILETALDRAAGLSDEVRAEIHAALGRLAARQGDGPAADDAMNRAIERAVDSGERDVLLDVAVQAGWALLELNRTREAAEAFERALALAETGDDSEPPRAGDLLKARVGIAEIEGKIESGLFALFPAALDDPECWWLLPRIARLSGSSRPRDDEAPTGAAGDGWRAFLAAARQRHELSA